MSATLKLDVVTPSGTAWAGDAEMVRLPSVDGEIGIFPRHVPLLTRIEPGEILVRLPGGSDERLAVGEGLAAVTGDHVAIVSDMAIRASDIDEVKVEEARQRALARLHDKISDEEVAKVNSSLARSLAQLRVKKRRRV